MNSTVIYDFTIASKASDWRIVNDGVMGGVSKGAFKIDEKGNGAFEGIVSLENNGGFSSVRHQLERIQVSSTSKICLYLKGDKKDYQFRIKDNSENNFSYCTTFKTSGEWQEIEVPLIALFPSFRGRKLDLPNFSSDSFEEIAFLIANQKNEGFKLIIDKIVLK